VLLDVDPRLAEAIVRGLSKGWPAGRPASLAGGVEEKLERLMTSLSWEGRATLVQLAVRWNSPRFEKYSAQLATALSARLGDESLGLDKRLEAAHHLFALRPHAPPPPH